MNRVTGNAKAGAILSVLAATALCAEGMPRLDRIPVDPTRPVTAFLPINSRNLRLATSQIRSVTRARFGLELLPDRSLSAEYFT